ncbi:hypothetical protein E2C01_100451 [Portunus trituberculatus]|uniref:Uncharacterized protein n=1 Tax=Portunus trituberculatus TaxID=210409 RepID=A0A5B7KD38_PORTR|nr:hypothetical protein [Portunus trituberculatus]
MDSPAKICSGIALAELVTKGKVAELTDGNVRKILQLYFASGRPHVDYPVKLWLPRYDADVLRTD